MMRIEFPVLSWLSTAVLIGAVLFGGTVSLYDISVSVEGNSAGFEVGVHPTFLCWMDTHDLFRGMCYGNVMICDSTLPTEVHKTRIVAHEARHLEHWHALGASVWLVGHFLELEPTNVDWADPSVELAEMWKPPVGWHYQWWWLRLSYDNKYPSRK